MTGRIADLFRLVWALLYWNTRKSWFQLRRGRSPCPCQSPSDSGRAFETACDACMGWDKPARFRRVCPLLVPTPQGLRCSADTADVRPFWGRAFIVYGGSFATLYLAAALSIFIFLRSVGYPVSIVHLVWPGSWHRVMEVRGWFFMERASRAFSIGRTAEGMLYLSNAYEFDPGSFAIGFTLAQKLQLGQPLRSDEIYREMIVRHPAQRAALAETWFRALLPRGDFATIQELAHDEILHSPAQASVWLRALIFASRQSGSDARVRELYESTDPAATPWRPVLEAELFLSSGRRAEGRAALNRTWNQAPPYALYYQVNELIALGDGVVAVDFIAKYAPRLDDTARVTLLLEAYATLQAGQSRQRLIAALLAQPLTPPVVSILAAHLIRHPDPAILDQVFAKFTHEELGLTDDTLQVFLALYCTAGVMRDVPKMKIIAEFLASHGDGSRFTLGLAGAFFRGESNLTRISTVLPALPMPIEVQYALLERYPGPRVKLPAP